jgi:hypothetical protein
MPNREPVASGELAGLHRQVVRADKRATGSSVSPTEFNLKVEFSGKDLSVTPL